MPNDYVKLFGLNNIAIETDLRRLEKEISHSIGHPTITENDKDERYYPQFQEKIRREAAAMARHYEVFYCLENSIRDLILARLGDEYGAKWWDEKVPEVVRKNAESNRKKEISSGITPRGTELIAYTNFGELGEIIKSNWDVFGEIFTDIRAVENVFARLNTLRAPIAHCCPLAEDEISRLKLSVKDWFRLME